MPLPNPADFSVNEKPNAYTITIRVKGTFTLYIKADSLEDAEAKAEKEVYRIAEEEEDCEIESIDDIRVEDVRKDPPMFRVLRDGKPCQVSYLKEGDLPREPIEHNF